MSDFEYLANLTVGQYLPLSSFFHERDPRAKLAGISMLVISLTLAGTLNGAAFGLAAILALLLLSRIPAGYALKGILRPLPFLVFLALLQVFITPHQANIKPFIEIFGINHFLARYKSSDFTAAKI